MSKLSEWLRQENPRMEAPNYIGITLLGAFLMLTSLPFYTAFVAVYHGQPITGTTSWVKPNGVTVVTIPLLEQIAISLSLAGGGILLFLMGASTWRKAIREN